MQQLALFGDAGVGTAGAKHDGESTLRTGVGGLSGPSLKRQGTTLPVAGPSTSDKPARPSRTPSSAEILGILRETTHEPFRDGLEPFLVDGERGMISVTEHFAHQRAIAYDHVVERLTWLWAELNAWPPFGRIVEPRTRVTKNLDAICLDLFEPSRGLEGRVAFRVERDLRRVTVAIPPAVLRLTQAHAGHTFRAFAFLEPIYSVPRRTRPQTLLRSLSSVRREHCRPIDPLVVGWLGAGPANYGLRFPVQGPRTDPIRRSSLGELVFLIGHWD